MFLGQLFRGSLGPFEEKLSVTSSIIVTKAISLRSVVGSTDLLESLVWIALIGQGIVSSKLVLVASFFMMLKAPVLSFPTLQ